ncbi:NfeD family protein [Dactylosporangium sp. AC04546]|uniref:NfeD family protein n=1 Tax=Dactylosporangium sp. AC04546 TaxID=2862460 RepID=UPI001EDD62CF|nr:NfeD family protein [Dactylosporangium sp. AC04546]WVK83863.1 NfeD family protein [Dactylosporangium sp. AC04546]
MQTTFLVIGGVGIVVLALSLLIGDVFHLGHPDAAGPFSIPAVAGFIGAFGFSAAIVAGFTDSKSLPALVGAIAALPTAWLATRFARMAINMRTDATPTQQDMVGTTGVVVTPITEGGYGEVRVSLGGQPVKLSARAEKPIPLGARIFVIEATSSTSVIVEETPL